MDLLEFGLENENSKSKVKKALAKGALAAAKKQADLTEAYVNRQKIDIPEGAREDEELLARIRAEIDSQSK